jgi:phosphotransferase system enzyme I (PtsI)
LEKAPELKKIGERLLKGIPASSGIALGKVCVHSDVFTHIREKSIEKEQISAEISRLKAVASMVRGGLETDRSRVLRETTGYDADIFSVHISILEDSHFLDGITSRIAAEGINAQTALMRELEKYTTLFSRVQDPYLRERIVDIRDIVRRLLEGLVGPADFDCPFDEPVIIATVEVAPSDTLRFNRERVLAFVTERGGSESHAAILARSIGIPAVVGLPGLLSRIKRGDFLVVDGDAGIVFINPPEEVVQDYRNIEAQSQERRQRMEELIPHPTVTVDGTTIKLMANAGSMVDLELALHYRAEGIGLFRTEFPFMGRISFPSEEEQFDLYRAVCEKMGDREVVIRTLDFGGDKLLPGHPQEKNPFLGYRSTRIFLDETDLFEVQLRAILRASAFGRVKVLFPLISTMDEVRKVKAHWEKVKDDLREGNTPFDDSIPLGIMIEVPSVAIMADRIVREVDFVSIGTNDLVQYTLAVDRDNELVSRYYQSLHPAVIWLVQHVVDAAKQAGKAVSICGEISGDPFYTALLVGLGLREFSVNPLSILKIRGAIRSLSSTEAQAIAETALALSTAEEVQEVLRSKKPPDYWMMGHTENYS